jgi:hypothetical protein
MRRALPTTDQECAGSGLPADGVLATGRGESQTLTVSTAFR